MYSLLLTFHSLLRWAVLAAGLLAAGRTVGAAAPQIMWRPGDGRAGVLFTILLDVQVLVGLVLYFFLSPLTGVGIRHLGRARLATST